MQFSLHSQVLDNLADGVTVQDREFNIIYQNRAMIAAFGNHVGEKCYQHYERRDEICEGCGVLKAFRDGKSHLVLRTAFGVDGTTSYWENACFPLMDENGSIIAGVEICRNITNRVTLEKEVKDRNIELGQVNKQLKRQTAELEQALAELKAVQEKSLNYQQMLENLNARLQQNQAQLVQSEKMASIGQLAAGVAHEINNPMGFIGSNLNTLADYVGALKAIAQCAIQLAERHGDTAEARAIAELRRRHDLDYILEDVDHLIAESADGARRVKEIVQSLKSFSRLDEAETKEANLNDCLETTLRVVWNELKYKCEVRRAYGKLPLLRCHPGQLNQVFMNLLVNAAQAIPEKGVITITTAADEKEIRVTIADTGRGIAPEHLPHIFEPFFTTKPVGQGTGLGLSVSYNIVRKHGGHIEASSNPGQGTTFTIHLPRAGVPDHE